MEILETDYIIGLWYVHGWIGEQEIDIQMTVKRNAPDAAWDAQARSRIYMDKLIDFRETKDKKSFYKIILGEDEYASEETLINKMESLCVKISNGLENTMVDCIMMHNMGSKFLEICESANKPWMNITRVPIEEAEKFMNISDGNS